MQLQENIIIPCPENNKCFQCKSPYQKQQTLKSKGNYWQGAQLEFPIFFCHQRIHFVISWEAWPNLENW